MGSNGRDRRAVGGLCGSYCGRTGVARARRAPRRWNRRSGAGLPQQSDAQCAARRAARDRRNRSAGARRLPAAGHRLVRFGYQHFESITTPAASSRRPTPTSARAAATSAWCRRSSTASAPATSRARPKPRCSPARETLRNAEQTALLDAATAYMNVLRDTAILDLQRRNVQVLQEQLKQTRDRFNVGEVTRTDVAQAEARLAASQSQVLNAEANLKSSQATYRRVIGVEPVNLRAGMPVDRLSPRTLEARSTQGRTEHPTVTAAQYTVDAAQHAVKATEGSLYPTVTLESSVQRRWDLAARRLRSDDRHRARPRHGADLSGRPEYSLIRQTKETLGQRRIELDVQRDQVRADVVQSWSQLEATKAQIIAAQAQVTATEVALNGVREEARVGQRTTLDVLNAQQELVNARVSLVTAQRDRVVASFTLLSAVGRLSPRLRLADRSLRSARPLPSGARQMDRRAHAGRPLRPLSSCCSSAGACPQDFAAFDLPHAIFGEFSHIARLPGDSRVGGSIGVRRESDMSQAAKAQEPSMEEILASIRRIIADDDGKPRRSPKPRPEPPPAAKAPPPPPPPKPAPAPPPAAAMGQDDIDAMLAGAGRGTGAGAAAAPSAPQPEPATCSSSPRRWWRRPRPLPHHRRQPGRRVRRGRARSTSAAHGRAAAPRRSRRFRRCASADRLVRDGGRGRFRVQCARPHRAGAERQDAGRPGEGDAAADAAALARQQSPHLGRASRPRRDRARRARAQLGSQALFDFLPARAGRAVARAEMFSATAARKSAFNAFSSILSPSRMSMARRVLPSEAGVEEA